MIAKTWLGGCVKLVKLVAEKTDKLRGIFSDILVYLVDLKSVLLRIAKIKTRKAGFDIALTKQEIMAIGA